MQPIFDLKGDNSQRADVSGIWGEVAKTNLCGLQELALMYRKYFKDFGLVFMRDKDYKISKSSTDLLYLCIDNTLQHTSSKTDIYAVCFYCCFGSFGVS